PLKPEPNSIGLRPVRGLSTSFVRAATTSKRQTLDQETNEGEDENPLMSATAAPEITVVDEPGRQRFEIRVDGEVAGFTEYRRSSGVIAFIHTLIDARFEGQGLGTRLVTDALSRVRAAGLAVFPFRPFARAFIAT